MATNPRHRSTARPSGLRRAGHLALAGAASVTAVGVTAPTAAAAETDNVWDRVAECESGGDWSINTGNGFYGGLQFWHPTWQSFGGEDFAPYAHQATKLQQITIGQKVLKVQGPGAWPVCSVRAGLTMENGLAPYPGQDDPAPAPGTWWVKATPGANIRSGPGLTYSIVGSAANGTQVTGTMSDGWVRLADGRGWVSATTLTTTAPAPAPAPPSSSTSWVVTATAGANIRSGPGTSYRIVGGAAHGTTVTGTLSDGWVRLADGGGYISGTILAPAGGGGASDMAPLVVDGQRGPLTVKAIQRWVGIAETGRWDTATIKALQSEVGTTPDGLWGPRSQAALQTRIGMTRDGSTYMNYRTVVALQTWLNANVIG
ncbi:transglycosylase family protein [Ornithinimicrobium tianjinense]|uniref:Transglycosylase n=1 Tax=Ornithinimicrobium tianjinense TaxID=1195761 RepID=A0A917BUC0_9MICO|nr:transglycosylase family protein [Ornithinimicrobium tianjinense]GGF56197.1 transglycosylase [Ornithinimicrobium tianjinense]